MFGNENRRRIVFIVLFFACFGASTGLMGQETATLSKGEPVEGKVLAALEKLRNGTEEEQKVASHFIWDRARYYGIGTLKPEHLTPTLKQAATQSPSDYVREYAMNALGELETT